MKVAFVTITAFLWIAASDDVRAQPETVPDIDLPNYLGRWYQMYANRFVFATFERDNVCVTADYGLNLNGTVSVENNARLGTPDNNKTNTIEGYAYMPNTAEPGKLSVVFSGVPGPPGEYWILKLGPLEESFPSVPLYQYSVVTDSRRVSLFILARNPQDFNTRFKDEVLKFVEQEGFTRIYNKPVETVQTSDCKYAGEMTESPKTNRNAIQEELKRILFH